MKKDVINRVNDHYTESLEYFSESNIVLIALQGSQNYNLDTPSSDVDTKLIITPSFKDIALAKQPVSTTHVRLNEEHIDFKDIRLYASCFRKQNLNFIEILFTDYFILNPLYAEQWKRLVSSREKIAHMNPYRAVKSMKGVAFEKYHAMEHRYPSKVAIIDKYGYDPKQLSHLARVHDFLEQYIAGNKYEDCLKPRNIGYILDIKNGEYTLEEARHLAEYHINFTEKMTNDFCEKTEEKEDPEMRELLEDVCYNIMKISVEKELKA